MYTLLSWLISPLALSHLLWRSLHDGGADYCRQRLGLNLPQLGSVIWLHAASVGEVHTARPIVLSLAKAFPDVALLVTTNTPTGRAEIEKIPLPDLHATYLPLDYAFALRRFVRANTILCGVIIETEIWPKLYEQVDAPLMILNGRVSRRTLKVTQIPVLAKIYQRAVAHLHWVFARSEDDANGFTRLGVNPERIETLGNLKFASALSQASTKIDDTPPLAREYCLLASTHHNEEEILAREWLQHNRPELLVIAPRHPDRRAQISRQLKTLDPNLCLRSRNERITEQTRLYLADTLGELNLWYRHAKSIFLGGSLVDKGGHNIIEPASHNKSVVVGPYTSNFTEVIELFDASDAITHANDAHSAVNRLIELADSPILAQQRGLAANKVLLHFDDIGYQYSIKLESMLQEMIR